MHFPWAHFLGASLLLLAMPAFAVTSVAPQIQRDITYAKVNGEPLLLDLYLPAASARPAPILVWIHGGSWQMGDKTFPFHEVFTKAGFALASINYRLTGEAPFPAQIYDCKAAVRWLRANAATYGMDPNRIAAVGVSAGAHLAALMGTTGDNPKYEGTEGVTGVSSRVQAVVDFSGPADFLTMRGEYKNLPANFRFDALNALMGGTIDEKTELARMASPALQVTQDACPFFIAHGDQDPMVPLAQSKELDEALKKAGVSSTLLIVPGGTHSLDPSVYGQALVFLRRIFPQT